MTSIARRELLRMERLMCETDPRTIEYTQLMRNFEILVSQLDMYDEVEGLLPEGKDMPQEVTVIPQTFETVRVDVGSTPTIHAVAPSSECSNAGTDGCDTTGVYPCTEVSSIERDTGADIAGNSPPSVSTQSKDLGGTALEAANKADSALSETTATSPTEAIAEAENHPEYKMEDVRAALVAARRKRGVNVTELLREFGVDNFSAFPAGRYWELMQRLGGDT